jgi:hypothetical protein
MCSMQVESVNISVDGPVALMENHIMRNPKKETSCIPTKGSCFPCQCSWDVTQSHLSA